MPRRVVAVACRAVRLVLVTSVLMPILAWSGSAILLDDETTWPCREEPDCTFAQYGFTSHAMSTQESSSTGFETDSKTFSDETVEASAIGAIPLQGARTSTRGSSCLTQVMGRASFGLLRSYSDAAGELDTGGCDAQCDVRLLVGWKDSVIIGRGRSFKARFRLTGLLDTFGDWREVGLRPLALGLATMKVTQKPLYGGGAVVWSPMGGNAITGTFESRRIEDTESYPFATRPLDVLSIHYLLETTASVNVQAGGCGFRSDSLLQNAISNFGNTGIFDLDPDAGGGDYVTTSGTSYSSGRNSDGDEMLDDEDPDDDNDGVLDESDGCRHVHDPDQANFDSDRWGDACDPDDENDELADVEEEDLGSDPFDADTDHDGLTDGREVHVHGCDVLDVDTDGDLFADATEVDAGSSCADWTSIPTPAGAVGGVGEAELSGTDGLEPVF